MFDTAKQEMIICPGCGFQPGSEGEMSEWIDNRIACEQCSAAYVVEVHSVYTYTTTLHHHVRHRYQLRLRKHSNDS